MKIWSILSVFTFISCASVQNRPLLAELELQGHRGARGLAPENTWPAFEAALAHGMNVLELDTVLTADGNLIIHHDTETNPALCRNDDGSAIQSQPIRNLQTGELKKLDCGSKADPKFVEQKPVPGTRLMTLDEFFAAIKKREATDPAARKVAFNVEAKFAEGATDADVEIFAATLLKKVRASGYQKRVTIQSFDHRILKSIKTLQADQRTSALVTLTRWQGLKIYLGLGGGVRADAIDKALAVKADILSPYRLYINASFVADAHAKNLAVIPWTVNDAGEMQRLLELGVDGIISDYPDRLQNVYKSRAAK
ncbi:glycerophosphodiester phosphodiesterase family protein [Turneriella parva]|uniref:Glycerophosphoryl diester phosphodiesterase n=1 Tax=Turneriella parva (strain ATCC BAA-1111 / DSM 21527 / NCTC 11395 / H) TaxID=869212 RepID=I4B1S5_TURPD|nr:glycerophosphodiester phosphodiesterase family protein [Turneriella parva]AFM11232.1 glycerophosphoryl diester phosphodiesterase [Turneriella parva DSM 21527]